MLLNTFTTMITPYHCLENVKDNSASPNSVPSLPLPISGWLRSVRIFSVSAPKSETLHTTFRIYKI